MSKNRHRARISFCSQAIVDKHANLKDRSLTNMMEVFGVGRPGKTAKDRWLKTGV